MNLLIVETESMRRCGSKLILGFIGLASLPALGGCVIRAYPLRPREVVVVDAPPAPPYEVRPVSPSNDDIWIEGHWIHRDGRWEWFGGHWEALPQAG